jgi:hypothetical protein
MELLGSLGAIKELSRPAETLPFTVKKFWYCPFYLVHLNPKNICRGSFTELRQVLNPQGQLEISKKK